MLKCRQSSVLIFAVRKGSPRRFCGEGLDSSGTFLDRADLVLGDGGPDVLVEDDVDLEGEAGGRRGGPTSLS